jgi:hypothetical protein
LTLITVACATAGSVRSQPLDAGEAKFYASPLPVVTQATRQAMLSAGLAVDTMSQPDSLTWMILGHRGLSLLSYGEVVRVIVQQVPEGAVAVRVVTKRRLATNITAKDWSHPIFERLDQILTQP